MTQGAYTRVHMENTHAHTLVRFCVCMHMGDYIHVVLCVYLYTYKCYE